MLIGIINRQIKSLAHSIEWKIRDLQKCPLNLSLACFFLLILYYLLSHVTTGKKLLQIFNFDSCYAYAMVFHHVAFISCLFSHSISLFHTINFIFFEVNDMMWMTKIDSGFALFYFQSLSERIWLLTLFKIQGKFDFVLSLFSIFDFLMSTHDIMPDEKVIDNIYV